MLAGEPRARALAFSLAALSVAGAAGPARRFLLVTAGLPIIGAMCPPDRDRRDKPGDDVEGMSVDAPRGK